MRNNAIKALLIAVAVLVVVLVGVALRLVPGFDTAEEQQRRCLVVLEEVPEESPIVTNERGREIYLREALVSLYSYSDEHRFIEQYLGDLCQLEIEVIPISRHPNNIGVTHRVYFPEVDTVDSLNRAIELVQRVDQVRDAGIRVAQDAGVPGLIHLN